VRTASDLPDGIRQLIVEGRAAWREQHYELARSLFEAALQIAREKGDGFGQVAALHFLGNLAFNECRDADARRLHSAALELSRVEGDDQGIATSVGSLALVDVAEGDFEAAQANFADSVAAYERAGMPHAVQRVRESADALVVRRAPLKTLVHRLPSSA
jgi:tetratricopeptide (TPR) repeat protein